ncbi:hypothetical protein AAG747_16445 [Rapidithrix thailandica]|uniref:Bacterial surface antigen (D15) domain-containing protein n=1 Tax=Rapidithrix thailandica TaxID=413964 RepID=A0AAW9SCJ3_9BACT
MTPSSLVWAQQQDSTSFQKHWSLSGGVSFLNEQPQVREGHLGLTYRPWAFMEMGAAAVLRYHQKPRWTGLGSRGVLRVLPNEKLPFLQLEASTFFTLPDSFPPTNAAYLGLGYRMPLGKRLDLQVLALKNLGEVKAEVPQLSSWTVRSSLRFRLGKLDRSGSLNKVQSKSPSGDSKADTTRWSFGGSGSVSAEGQAAVAISPVIEYRLNKHSSLGLGPSFQYHKADKETEETVNYGLRFYGKYRFSENSPFLQIEYEGISRQDSLQQRRFVSTMLAGAGYRFALGELAGLELSLLRDTRPQATGRKSPWVFRVGYHTSLGASKNKSWMDKLKEKPFDIGKIRPPRFLKQLGWEGGLGVQLGKPPRIEASPMLTWSPDSTLTLGVGPSFQASKETFQSDSLQLEYGLRAFARFYLLGKAPYVQVEYEALRNASKHWQSGLLAGGGYELKLSKAFALTATVLYRLSGDRSGSPWVIRTGYKGKMPVKDKLIPGFHPPEPPSLLNQALQRLEGTLGMVLGEQLSLNLSPALAFKLGKVWTLGAGPSFLYAKNHKNGREHKVYGGRAYLRYRPENHLPFLQVEGESLRTQEGGWNNALLAGAGVAFPVFYKGRFSFGLFRDLTWSGPTAIRAEPWIVRLGLVVE